MLKSMLCMTDGHILLMSYITVSQTRIPQKLDSAFPKKSKNVSAWVPRWMSKVRVSKVIEGNEENFGFYLKISADGFFTPKL